MLIRVVAAPSTADVVGCFRAATGYSINAIREAVRAHSPLQAGRLLGLDHDEVEPRIMGLLDCLEACHAGVEIIFEDEMIGRELLENSCRQWHDIGRYLSREDERRFGDA